MLARTALGSAVARRAGPLVARFADGFRDGAFNYLLFMRLIPVFPFWMVNVVPALCGVRLATYVAATAIGIVPMTLAFAFFGAGLDSVLAVQVAQYRACLAAGGADCRLDFELAMVLTPQLIVGLVALGIAALLPIAVRRLRAGEPRRLKPTPPPPGSAAGRRAAPTPASRAAGARMSAIRNQADAVKTFCCMSY